VVSAYVDEENALKTVFLGFVFLIAKVTGYVALLMMIPFFGVRHGGPVALPEFAQNVAAAVGDLSSCSIDDGLVLQGQQTG
jgi:hypothetical protein